MDFKDYYSMLGVAKTASAKEIKAAYRKLARKHHPDVNPGDKSAEKRIKDLNEAYEVLGDADKRKKYDELGSNWRAYEQAGAGAGPGYAPGFDPSQGGWNVNFGGGQAGARTRTMTEDDMREMFGGADSPFSDFFNTFFGSASPAEETGSRGPVDTRRPDPAPGTRHRTGTGSQPRGGLPGRDAPAVDDLQRRSPDGRRS